MPEPRVPRLIPGYSKSYALLAPSDESDTAIVFVHGFGGKPTSTWTDFQGLVDQYPSVYPGWSRADMFFYAYDSRQTPIRRNAELLAAFVERAWHNDWQRPVQPTKRCPRYLKLILTGHSEGGVILRRLILDRVEAIWNKVRDKNPVGDATILHAAASAEMSRDFLLLARLCLFAPACLGTNFSSWIGFATSVSHFVSAMATSSLVRNELLPGSPVLQNLQTGTEAAHQAFPEIRSLFIQPLFGIPDQVVVSDSYKGELLLWDEGFDHFTICKPRHLHQRPIQFVHA